MNLHAGQFEAQRVLFGAGLRHTVRAELEHLDVKRALVLSTPAQSSMAMDLAGALGSHAAGVYTKAAMHTPVTVTEDALAHAGEVGADCTVAIGGGSTIGLGKAMAYRSALRQLAVPTTYAGSEATPILGQTMDGVKKTLTNPRVLPETVLYDPELVVSLPRAMTVTSALNAMAHAAEALYAEDRTPETTELALDGLAAFIEALPRVLEAPDDLEAREETMRGAWACGAVLGRVGMALHHKLCHTLGGSFDLPHADTHAIILPHAVHFNAAAVPQLLAPVAELLGGGTPGHALWNFAQALGAPTALLALGVAEADLDRAADLAVANPYWNPRDIDRADLRALLQDAWSGAAPGTHT
ncbi:MAG: maleylacetate reductase [Pseudomonadota bacterium]